MLMYISASPNLQQDQPHTPLCPMRHAFCLCSSGRFGQVSGDGEGIEPFELQDEDCEGRKGYVLEKLLASS